MKRTNLITLLAATMIATMFAAGPAAAAEWFGVSISNHGLSLGFGSSNWGIWGSSWAAGGWSAGYTTTLSGYGEWVWVDGVGRCWRPWVAAGWRPFTHGKWVWTSQGWTWVSYEPWGWAPHHYGNWAMTTSGWVWAPGYTYHPGNVVWVRSGGYVGWYPCGPHGWSHSHRAYNRGWNSGYSHGHWNGYNQGYSDGWRDARHATWVPWSHMGADNVAHHAVGHDHATRGVARSSVVATANAPSRTEVERHAGRPVPEARIVERKVTIDGREVRMVRPEGQTRNIERHAATTVDRALAPRTRERVTAEPARKDRSASSDSRSVVRGTASSEQDRGSPRTTSGRSSSASSVRVDREKVSGRSNGPAEAASRRDASVQGSRNRTQVSSTAESPNRDRRANTTSRSRTATHRLPQPVTRSSQTSSTPPKTRVTTEGSTTRKRKAKEASPTATASSSRKSTAQKSKPETAPTKRRRSTRGKS